MKSNCFVPVLKKFQSTRPRGARRVPGSKSKSIGSFNPRAHAGRDRSPACILYTPFVFQSTRPRGARQRSRPRNPTGSKFQSTRPRGARPKVTNITSNESLCFNPRAHAGRDQAFAVVHMVRDMFQSTRPRGARQKEVIKMDELKSFNPRAHAGRDAGMKMRAKPSMSFNPRAHAGRDLIFFKAFRKKIKVSIHAPTRGATSLHRFQFL